MGEDVDDDGKLGVEKVGPKKMSRIPDEVLDELGVEVEDHIGFKTCDDDHAVKLCKVEVDF
jgi:hypothetical protein